MQYQLKRGANLGMSLLEKIEDVVSRERSNLSLSHRILLAVLRLLSLFYGSVVLLRNMAYRSGSLPRKKLPRPVISIGNILAGGAGKTPTVIYLAGLLKARGYRPAVLSRGYCRDKDAPEVQVVTSEMRVEQTGDEPLLIARRLPGVPILVGRDRYQSGKLGMVKFKPDLFLLDDAFQHLTLERDLDIVVIDVSRPLIQPLLPRGYLREPLSGLERAGAFLLTRIDQTTAQQVEAVEEYLSTRFPGRRIFHASYQPVGLIPYSQWVVNSGFTGEDTLLQEFRGKKAGLFAGVASPASVRKTVSRLGVCVVNTLKLADHQPITAGELVDFSRESLMMGAEILITTEKDAVKLEALRTTSETPELLPLYILTIELSLREGEEDFLHWLAGQIPIQAGK
ncbi:MAG TPA: tetraacyldisaccharide 4'-kinase [Firmicutes bacterium]|nr:tetraacyldisaccharide 4'-kinase [Bacillota bacterium]